MISATCMTQSVTSGQRLIYQHLSALGHVGATQVRCSATGIIIATKITFIVLLCNPTLIAVLYENNRLFILFGVNGDGVATDDFYVLDVNKKQWEKGVGGMNTHCCSKSGGGRITQSGMVGVIVIVVVLLLVI